MIKLTSLCKWILSFKIYAHWLVSDHNIIKTHILYKCLTDSKMKIIRSHEFKLLVRVFTYLRPISSKM